MWPNLNRGFSGFLDRAGDYGTCAKTRDFAGFSRKVKVKTAFVPLTATAFIPFSLDKGESLNRYWPYNQQGVDIPPGTVRPGSYDQETEKEIKQVLAKGDMAPKPKPGPTTQAFPNAPVGYVPPGNPKDGVHDAKVPDGPLYSSPSGKKAGIFNAWASHEVATPAANNNQRGELPPGDNEDDPTPDLSLTSNADKAKAYDSVDTEGTDME